jgi:hypothetical protein
MRNHNAGKKIDVGVDARRGDRQRGQADNLMLLYFPVIEREAESRRASLVKDLSIDILKFAVRRQAP